MVRVRVTTSGLREIEVSLAEAAERLGRPLRSLMNLLAQDWASTFQRQILERELDLPEPHPATVAIRRYYGHDGKPRLFRGGDLAHSIGPLDIGDFHLEVGTTVEFAGVLMHGGQVTDRRGRQHTVQPHPFMVLDAEMVDDAAGMVADYILLGEEGLA